MIRFLNIEIISKYLNVRSYHKLDLIGMLVFMSCCFRSLIQYGLFQYVLAPIVNHSHYSTAERHSHKIWFHFIAGAVLVLSNIYVASP